MFCPPPALLVGGAVWKSAMENDNDRSAGSVKTVEVWVAAIVLLFGALVVYDSFRLGAGWGNSGPQTGYFPFYIGLLICVSSVVNLVLALRDRAGGSKSFVSRQQLKLIMVMLVDRKSTRLNSSHSRASRMPSSA